jgi:hypothetical protein
MSSMEIDRLVQEGSLSWESFEDAHLAAYWAKVAASFADAQTAGLSRSGALRVAYTTALRANVASLAAHGLRVNATDDDHLAFHAAENLGGAMGHHAGKLDAVRLAGDQWMYGLEDNEEEISELLRRAFDTLREVLPAIREEIVAVRPSLESRLAMKIA